MSTYTFNRIQIKDFARFWGIIIIFGQWFIQSLYVEFFFFSSALQVSALQDYPQGTLTRMINLED